MKWFSVKNYGLTGDIYIYGEITNDKWFDTDVTPSDIAQQLKELENVSSINLYVNSPGGSVFAGVAIYNTLKRLDKPITAYIDGVAASIASLIVLAADTVVMPSTAQYMIHNPFVQFTSGDAETLRKTADRLDAIKDILVSVYTEKTGLGADEISKMMDVETWLDGNKALELGFSSELGEEIKIAACASPEKIRFNTVEVDTSNFKNFPADKVRELMTDAGNNALAMQQNSHRHKMNMLSAQLQEA